MSLPAIRVPPRFPASLYDVFVLISGVQDARSAMLMQIKLLMTWCIDATGTHFYKVVNIVHEYVTKVKHLLHSLLQVIINQQAIMVLQRYTKHHFILFFLCIARVYLFNYY